MSKQNSPPTYDEVSSGRIEAIPSAPPTYEATLDQITAELATSQMYDTPPETNELPEKHPLPRHEDPLPTFERPSSSHPSAPFLPRVRPGSLFPDRRLRQIAGEEEDLPKDPLGIEAKVVYTDPDLKAKVTPFKPPTPLNWTRGADGCPRSIAEDLPSRFCTRCDGWHSGRCRSRSADEPPASTTTFNYQPTGGIPRTSTMDNSWQRPHHRHHYEWIDDHSHHHHGHHHHHHHHNHTNFDSLGDILHHHTHHSHHSHHHHHHH